MIICWTISGVREIEEDADGESWLFWQQKLHKMKVALQLHDMLAGFGSAAFSDFQKQHVPYLYNNYRTLFALGSKMAKFLTAITLNLT